MQKKHILLFLIIALILGSGFLLFKLFASSNKMSRDHKDLSTQTGNILDKFSFDALKKSIDVDNSAKSLNQISASQTTSAANGSYPHSVLYHIKNTGSIIESNIETLKSNTLFSDPLSVIVSVMWSPDRHSAIHYVSKNYAAQFIYQDYISGTSTILPFKARSISFSSDGTKIAFFTISNDISSLFISKPDGTMARKIFQTRLLQTQLHWPSGEYIYFTSKNPNLETWDVFRTTLDGKLERILTDKRELEIMLSKDGKHMLYSALDDNGMHHLYSQNTSSMTVTNLALHGFASRCVWSIDSIHIFCGIPASANSVNNAYEKITAAHDIYAIDIKKLSHTTIFETGSQEPHIHIQNLFLSLQEDYLFFINKFNGKLYSLRK